MAKTHGTAYSYMRFSTPDQRKGDSIRRQTAVLEAYVERHRLRLDTSLTFIDAGVSGHRGLHRSSDKYALGHFLSLVTSGRIAAGSYLIVESLDRLSREDIDEALELLLSLIRSGIKVVQLLPAEIVYEKPVEPMKLMMGIMELSRGHSESRMKSERIGAAWANKRADARSARRKAVSKWCPHWLRKNRDSYEVIPDRVRSVQRIFELSADGYGVIGIIKKLIEEGREPFGRSGRWSNSYVGLILSGRAVLGEYQPLKGKKPCGDPISGYYPAVIDESLFYRVQAGLKERLKHAGGRSKHDVNLFQGLMWNALDGDRIEYRWFYDYQSGKKRGMARYVNSLALAGQATLKSFPVSALERGVLSSLAEIDPRDVLPQKSGVEGEIVSLRAKLAETEARLQKIEDELVQGDAVEVLVKAAQRLAQQKRALTEKLADARQTASSEQGNAWGNCQSLIGALEAAADKETIRLRLRSAIRRVVERIECIFVRKGRRQIACVQLHFLGTGAIRTVFVRYRAPLTNIKDKTPEHVGWSTLKDELPDRVDIAKQTKTVVPVLLAMCEEQNWHRAFEPDRPTSGQRIRSRKLERMRSYKKQTNEKPPPPPEKAHGKKQRASRSPGS